MTALQQQDVSYRVAFNWCMAFASKLTSLTLSQGIWWDDVPMLMLPHMTEDAAQELVRQGLRSLHQMHQAAARDPASLKATLTKLLGGSKQASECFQVFLWTDSTGGLEGNEL